MADCRGICFRMLVGIFLFINICIQVAVQAQQVQNLSPHTIGESVPDIKLPDVVNYSDGTLKLSDFRNKSIIIDFFATNCPPCVTMLPHMDSLQRKYRNSLQFIVVTSESKETIEEFLSEKFKGKIFSFPFVVRDTLVNRLFPHRIIPHEVWISKQREVIAATTHRDVNEQNIQAFLTKGNFRFVEKIDDVNYDASKPLFVNNNGGNGAQFLGRSILTRASSQLPSAADIDLQNDRTVSRFISTNDVPLGLFYLAYSNFQLPLPNLKRIIFETKDSAELKASLLPDVELAMRIGCCYELILPQRRKREVFFKYVMEDLNKYFSYSGFVETREMSAWKLVVISDTGSFSSVAGLSDSLHRLPPKTINISRFVSDINRAYQMEPVIIGPGIDINKQIGIRADINTNRYPDVTALNNELQQYGLRLERSFEAVQVLVMKDKPESE